jgi:hypothetical protein
MRMWMRMQRIVAHLRAFSNRNFRSSNEVNQLNELSLRAEDIDMTTIGILSSINFNTAMQNSFMAGLNMAASPPTLNIQDKKGYGKQLLDAATYLVGQNVDLIATFGGLIACAAAQKKDATVPFISLVGAVPSGTPAPGTAPFSGCVSLESFTLDVVRLSWLSNIQMYAPATVGLLYNSNSTMANQELAAWKSANGGQAVDATNGWADPTQFGNDFSKFGGSIQAVVISADPYFYKNRETLVPAANTAGFYMCYPFRGYANTNTGPTANNAVIFGPDLSGQNNQDAAYYQMGIMAAAVINKTPFQTINKHVAQIIYPL